MKDKMRNDDGIRQPWMAIHAREMFVESLDQKNKGGLGQAFACANKMLAEGLITKVFFAADTVKLRKAAMDLISESSALIMADDSFHGDKVSFFFFHTLCS